ncbi:FG-GAP repeat domain-containing protein [Streptomyces sp. NPDC088553]|uniref:FG-GAP repeat domain-containing protein n=1 Tax=Streptomyces sp. NPDC088553 TaxID=3365864 RepID=UPI003829E188
MPPIRHTGTRTRSRRLTAAIAAALAVTAGSMAAAPAATATTQAAAAATTTVDAVPAFPLDSEIISAGTTGYLSRNASGEYRWTRTADGTSTVVDSQAPVLGAASDVLVATVGDRVLRLTDMATTGATPVDIDLKTLTDGTHTAFGAVGTTVLTSVTTPAGATELHLVSPGDNGTATNRTVTGLPAGAGSFTLASAIPGTALVGFKVGGKTQFAVIDLATNTAPETYQAPLSTSESPSAALSATHVAWVETTRDRNGEPQADVVVTDRKTAESPQSRRFRVQWEPMGIRVGLTGNWVTYGEDATDPVHFRHPFIAQPLTAGSGSDKPLLAHATSLTTAPDGSLLVRGGSLTDGEGEGLYRVVAGADGTIDRRLVAGTGETTRFVVTGHNITDTIEFDKNGVGFPFTFSTNRKGAHVSFEIKYAGANYRYDWRGEASVLDSGSGPGSVTLRWDGHRLDSDGEPSSSYGLMRNGPVEWTAIVSPVDGVGGSVELSGTSTITRKPHPHDFTDDGSPDLLMHNQGYVSLKNSMFHPKDGSFSWEDMSTPYTGWSVYDRFSVPGDLGGSNAPEIITRDKSGDLWLYSKAEGNSYIPKLAPRVRIGSNWGVYDKIVGGSDVTADGKPDLLATDKSGGLWLYPGTGDLKAPFGDRKKIGGGWGIYNQIVATGNLAGAPAGDLVARDAAGVLWMYLGNGDGTFAPRVKLGGGWNEYTRIVSVGDLNYDGYGDLITYAPENVDIPTSPSSTNAYVYWGTGDWRAPFKPRVARWVPGKGVQDVF